MQFEKLATCVVASLPDKLYKVLALPYPEHLGTVAGTHPKIVQEHLGRASIQITLDTYSHVAPGLQEAAANRSDKMVSPKRENEAIEKVH